MKLISGGQTGADRAALDVAIELGMVYGGSIPKGRRAEDGLIDLERYPNLKELDKGNYLARTRKNVEDADATLAFTDGVLTGGTRKTIEFAKEYGKPYLQINLKKVSAEDAVNEIIEWLNIHKPRVLNVAGSRESGAPGIYLKVYGILKIVFQQVASQQR
ncbi:MAG TPA: putative molybdenum carrier protein [Nitrospirota bacterium]|nr:putative molybdenum carrier protein [Nitrospirota bacterium]